MSLDAGQVSNACSDHDLQGIFDAFDSFNMGITPVGVGLAVSPECTQGAPLTQPSYRLKSLADTHLGNHSLTITGYLIGVMVPHWVRLDLPSVRRRMDHWRVS